MSSLYENSLRRSTRLAAGARKKKSRACSKKKKSACKKSTRCKYSKNKKGKTAKAKKKKSCHRKKSKRHGNSKKRSRRRKLSAGGSKRRRCPAGMQKVSHCVKKSKKSRRRKLSAGGRATATTTAGQHRQVFEGRAGKTSGGLTKQNLKKSKSGKIVSVKKSNLGKKIAKKNGLADYAKDWRAAVQEACNKHNDGNYTVPRKNTPLYKAAKKIYNQLRRNK